MKEALQTKDISIVGGKNVNAGDTVYVLFSDRLEAVPVAAEVVGFQFSRVVLKSAINGEHGWVQHPHSVYATRRECADFQMERLEKAVERLRKEYQ